MKHITTERLPLLPTEPYYRTVVWGGEAICALKGEPPAGPSIGESWEVSDLDGSPVTIGEGAGVYSGKTLPELCQEKPDALLGPRLRHIYGKRFPLLVKIIDAHLDLSIQVHPDDYLAYRRHGASGKAELWYILNADENAFIYSGLKRTVTPADLREHIAKGSVTSLLARFKPVRGDYFYLPAGRIHAAGGGSMVLEIQQPSDITYRIYDYGRPGLDGKLRPLHIEEALEAIDFRVHDDYCRHIDPIPGREQVLQECPHFIATLVRCSGEPVDIKVSRYLSPRVLVSTQGNGTVTDDLGNSVVLRQGHTVLVPASTPKVTITPAPETPDLEIVTAYIP